MSTTVAEKKEKISVPFDYDKYLRPNKLPHIWCPGCGHGIVLKAMLRAIDKAGLDKNNVCMVSGIGCSSRTPGYVDFNTMHTIHGRAPAFATGIKLAKPEMKVIVITGDGDALAIGGNHFIHVCRRNIDMTILVMTNATYGMTGGQFSPTSPMNTVSTTSRYGSIEPPFDACEMAKAAGATFVARGTAYHTIELEKTLFEAIQHKGTSVVDIIDACPTYFGRANNLKSASQMMDVIEKDGTVNVKQADKLPPEKLEGKFLRGILHRAERPEYTEAYQTMVTEKAAKK
ncbi:MAG TPA: 2-oxoacid:ferredoxin oxidoreductase subunit beta [Deltaproteobacteria bacterium]|nr:MAG: 2-oxoacid:ferredoxin oxidoreductase subunit beta [Deltaproteobacteria bacterium GWA2_55_82]OGQ63631.1 MAG: 2-oxoacid:ferredoxin oxidoreductase subunit beta [Deltaproteobacteria bacterium RIFCSPLOWO2_02_FULL_55_12]OIJ74466.1 MAG: 2-oxoacid:ferredoxin oxidoreductase subunit beta [Deltaproteobacteria bacterium GWC2_55_46]HBG47122.1 2-oxoacid:ferredoxin oxidoreductase subunit beta [Deltaproteobacteria bacterium]HCY10817.1 2-oxoacid:ferredoxin oxidoreductase subunit beta [Deltaproteobacteria